MRRDFAKLREMNAAIDRGQQKRVAFLRDRGGTVENFDIPFVLQLAGETFDAIARQSEIGRTARIRRTRTYPPMR